MFAAATLPAATARITVAGPVTASPPANTCGVLGTKASEEALILPRSSGMTCVTAPDDPHARDRAIDRAVLSRRFGIPLMLLLLALVFWLTLSGANTVSAMLSGFLLGLEAPLRRALTALSLPSGAVSLLTDGVWRVLATVVSVMLPPMAIFFPLFTLLEDAGYLPRIALQLDHAFCRAGACGKQSLSMCLRTLRAQKNRTG